MKTKKESKEQENKRWAGYVLRVTRSGSLVLYSRYKNPKKSEVKPPRKAK